MVENNPHTFSKLSTGTLTQLEDEVDYPHSGLFKALVQMSKGNVVIKNGTNDFDITQAGSGNVIQVSGGSYFREGKLFTVSGTTNFTESAFTTTYDKGYHMLVVNSSNTVVIRQPTAADRVPNYTDGDTIIALIEISSTTSYGSRLIQFLTTEKTSNSVNIGYNDSGYTEAMSIEGSATRTLFKNRVADADIRFVLADNTADEKFEIYSDDDSDGDEGDTEIFSVDGTGVTKVKSLSLGTAAELTITESSDDITIKNTVSDKDIIFNINDGGSDTEVMRIDGSTSRVGIGTNAPSAPLHVETTGTDDSVIVESTSADANHAPDIIFYRNSSSPADNDGIGHIKFRGRNDNSQDVDYADFYGTIRDASDTTEDGELNIRTVINGALANRIHIDPTEIVINEDSADLDFRVESNGEANMIFVEGSTDRVGIANDSPDANLDVGDGKTFRSTHILSLTSTSSTLNLTLADHAGRYIMYNSSSGTVNLPSSATLGEHYTILNITGGNITIGRNGNSINGATSNLTLGTFKAVTCICMNASTNDWIALGV